MTAKVPDEPRDTLKRMPVIVRSRLIEFVLFYQVHIWQSAELGGQPCVCAVKGLKGKTGAGTEFKIRGEQSSPPFSQCDDGPHM